MDWDTSREFPPIALVGRGKGKGRLIRSVRGAAEALLTAWPSQDGENYLAAVKTCLEALQGRASSSEVQAALIRAADEDRIAHMSLISRPATEQPALGYRHHAG